jgi:hypothetical protein
MNDLAFSGENAGTLSYLLKNTNISPKSFWTKINIIQTTTIIRKSLFSTLPFNKIPTYFDKPEHNIGNASFFFSRFVLTLTFVQDWQTTRINGPSSSKQIMITDN